MPDAEVKQTEEVYGLLERLAEIYPVSMITVVICPADAEPLGTGIHFLANCKREASLSIMRYVIDSEDEHGGAPEPQGKNDFSNT